MPRLALLFPLLLFLLNPVPASTSPATLPGCQVYTDNQCSGSTIVTNSSMAARRWFTPARGSPGYLPSFQDYSHLAAYVVVSYTDATRTAATVTVRATQRGEENGDTPAPLTYIFNGTSSSSSTMNFSAASWPSGNGPLHITVTASPHSIDLEPVDFYWALPALPPQPGDKKSNQGGDYRGGLKGAIVELFGWPDADVASECDFLASAGYLGVKLFPHQEQLMSNEPFQNVLNPWYFMYQPVSYRLQGRMGDRNSLRDLISACRSKGVRVYADAVINHMTGGGNDMNRHHRRDAGGGNCVTWGNKSSSGAAGPSPFYTQDMAYLPSPSTGLPPSQEFPAAAYGPMDFHCERALNSWNDPLDLNAGWLTGLTDLNTERDHVRERIAAYLTDLLSIGFTGFRIDAAKHIKPDDLVAILVKLRRNLGGELPADFITWLEVLLGGESDMLMCDGGSGYNYGAYLQKALAGAGLSTREVDAVKIWNSGYPKETAKGLVGCDPSAPKIRSVIQNDDADQQNPGSTSRDMGSDGCILIKEGSCSSVDAHRQFEVKLFQSPNGAQDNDNDFPIRVVLSSFYWHDGAQGVPDGKSDCSRCTTNCDGCRTVPYTPAYNASSQGYDPTGYTRVHRDAAIVRAMRQWMHLED